MIQKVFYRLSTSLTATFSSRFFVPVLPLFMAIAIFCVPSRPLFAEDLTGHYQYPLSVGFRFTAPSYPGLADAVSVAHDSWDLATLLRMPLSGFPQWVPLVEGGLSRWAPQDSSSSWAHDEYYLMAGAGWARRFSKSLELGGELMAGPALVRFDTLLPGGDPVYVRQLILSAVGRLSFFPSWQVGLELSPLVRWAHAFDALDEFSGLRMGLGLSIHLRLGEDPDADNRTIRSLKLDEQRLPVVFPAMQSWYTTHPVAIVTVTNTEKFPLEDLEFFFFQKQYMDNPTPCALVERLAPGESIKVPILASFNETVFRNEGITPLSGELRASFRSRARIREQTFSLGFDLMDKSAITWDDDRKAVAFVTPSDGALRNYASHIRQAFKEQTVRGYDPAVQYAVQLFHALGELGLLYQADPVASFKSMQENQSSVDSISLPRDTLMRITGDCDDLSVLYASMLETVGIETALVTVPGHIYIAFNTMVPSRNFADIHPERHMTIAVKDQLWVPLEITMTGEASFPQAWEKGAEQWRTYSNSPESRGFYPVREAWELYRPVGLRETDLGLQYGNTETIRRAAAGDIDALVTAMLARYEAAARERGGKEDWNRLGIRLAQCARHEAALSAFGKALGIDRGYTMASLNMANTYFLMKNYRKALAQYEALDRSLPVESNRTRDLLVTNWHKCLLAVGETERAAALLTTAGTGDALAQNTSEERAESAGTTTDTSRALAATNPAESIIFGE